jgi:cytochrome oxidase Cu insertion factor (SCO1/SenC/PrrC family)
MSQVAAGQQKRGIVPLLAMVAIFAAPVIAAWFFYLNPGYLPAGRTNKGELIEPVVPLPPELRLSDPSGLKFDPAGLAGKWVLVYLARGECGDACMEHLIAIRQIRLALGESQFSVDRLLIMTDPSAGDLAARLAGELDGMQVALTDEASGPTLTNALGEGALGRIYILDPMGNLMMRYAPDAPAKDTLKDMERLLKASKSWIKGAQYGHQ